MAAWADLRYSARSLTRTPVLTLNLLLTIALAIGSNAAVAGFVRGLLTRDLPIPGVDAVVSLFARDAQDTFGPLSYEDFQSLAGRRDTFAWIGAAREAQSNVELRGRSLVMSVAAVTPEIAALFQLSLKDGIVISHRVWQVELGARGDVRGEEVRVHGIKRRVAGVAPEWLEGLYVSNDVDIWVPLETTSLQGNDRRSRSLRVLGRLRPGLAPGRAQAAVNATRSGDMIAVLPYTGMTPEAAGGMARIGTLLSVAAGAVFFIGCANVATFLLSRASARSREWSVRVALGASRGQVARLLLADSLLVSVTGGALGLLLAVWTSQVVPALFFEQDAEHLSFIPDLVGIVAASATCVAITVACGLIPLVEIRHDDPATVLRRESAGPSNSMRRVRAALVVAQMACCYLLVISAGLLLKGFRTTLETSAGHRLGSSLLATLESRSGFTDPDLGREFFRRAEREARSLPDVSGAAWVGTLPGTPPVWQSVRAEPPARFRDAAMGVAAFTPLSLARVILPPSAGRMFRGGDTPQTCRVAVVNEEAAHDVFDGDAVGRVIEDPEGERVEVVGVVATRKSRRAGQVGPTIYYYAEQTGIVADRIGLTSFRVPVRAEPAQGVLHANVVSSNYFDVMGLRLIAGSVLPAGATRQSCRVGVVNQEAAELYFGGNAVGGVVIDSAGRRTEIIGVVHAPLLRTSQRPAEPTIYLPMSQDFLPRMTLILSVRNANDAMLASVLRSLQAVSGGRLVAVTTLEAHLGRTVLASERIAMVLVATSAGLAVALGVLGLYGAMTDAAHRRRREFAVRIALGAQRWRVIGHVLMEGLRLACAGSVAGMLGSLLVARWLARTTPNAGSLTGWVWLAAPLVLAGAVVMASVLPARRASAVDPLAVMQEE